eukprot:SAG11_NODE_1352_length_5131_cov_19.593402_4_plen_112_part_00
MQTEHTQVSGVYRAWLGCKRVWLRVVHSATGELRVSVGALLCGYLPLLNYYVRARASALCHYQDESSHSHWSLLSLLYVCFSALPPSLPPYSLYSLRCQLPVSFLVAFRKG